MNFFLISVFAALICSVISVPMKIGTMEPKNITDNSNGTDIKLSTYYITIAGIGKHQLHLNKKNWEDARVVCLNEGAHLAVIKSAQEEEIIRKQITEKKLDEVWIGIHEQFKNGDWVTVHDQRLDSLGFINWREGEPNNYQDTNEHCVSLTTGGWNDLACNKEHAFLCKIVN